MSENLFHRRFWLGDTDARSLAFLRMALGALVMFDLVDRLRDFHAFYTAPGIVHSSQTWREALFRWSILDLTERPGATLALFLLAFVPAIAFSLGYRTRLAGCLLWIFVTSIHNRSPYIIDGGDAVLQTLLFWAMFTDAGAWASLDVRLGRRSAAPRVPALGLRFLQLQVALIYVVTFLAKNGSSWRDGSAVFRALTVSDWGRALAPIVAQSPELCRALTYSTLVIEAAFPLLVLSPWRTQATRTVALALGAALHVSIFATMRVGIFSLSMLVSYLVFVPSRWLDRLSSRRTFAWLLPPTVAGTGAPALVGHRRVILLLLLSAQFAMIVFSQVARSANLTVPRVIRDELRIVHQSQNWRMFAPEAPSIHVVWEAPAVLADDRTIELVSLVAPGLREHGGFFYSRWLRLRHSLIMEPEKLTRSVGRYLCRRYNGEHPGPPVVRFELVAHIRNLDGSYERKVGLRQPCR